MTRILVVCLGNICRSPMAEAVFRQLIDERGLSEEITIASAATSNWNDGQAPHQGTQAILAEHQISCEGLISQQVKEKDFFEYDLILAMDQQNKKDLQQLAPQSAQEKIKLFLAVLPEHDYTEVPDPYYTGDFQLTYDLVSQATVAWLDQLNKKKNFPV